MSCVTHTRDCALCEPNALCARLRTGAATKSPPAQNGGNDMTHRELELRNALASTMQVDPETLSMTAEFSQQGVDSLIALRFIRRIEDMIGTEVDLEWAFDYPTLRDLARFLDERFAPPIDLAA